MSHLRPTSRFYLVLAGLMATTAFLHAQLPSAPTWRGAPAPESLLNAWDLSAGTLQELQIETLPEDRVQITVLLGEHLETIVLHPREIRTPSYQLRVETSSGWQSFGRDACVTYRGTIARQGALVAATWDPRVGTRGHFEAMVLDQEETWVIQPLEEVERQARGYGWLVHRGADQHTQGLHCGAGIFPPRVVGAVPESSTVLREAEIALDADREFWVRKGSNATQTQNAMLSIMNAVDLIYRRDVCLQYFVSSLFVRTTSIYSATDMGVLLGEFQNYWTLNHASVARDIAHLFTGKGSFSGTVGIAYLGTICDRSSGYGVSRAYSSSFNTNVELVAHELGHNWNAGHCGGGGCFIMCPGLGGCNGTTNQFGTASINAITNYARGLSCLRYANGTPVLQSLQPSSAQAYGGGTVQIVGTGFLGTQTITIGGVAIPLTSINVQDDAHIVMTVPRMSQLGALPVVVTNNNASSNGLALQIIPTFPARLETTPLVAIQGQTVSWNFGADGDDLYSLAITANDSSTIPFLGDTLLASGFPILSGVLSSAGIGSIILPGVPRIPGLTVYSQIWTLSNTTAGWGGASNITTTFFF